jgi:hypothetical protein
VLGAEPGTAAVGGADDQRDLDLAVRHVAGLGDLVDDDVPAHGEEVAEHDLGDGPEPGHRGPHGRAEDRLLGDGRVHHPTGSELVEETHGRLEDAAGPGDILADEEHPVVTLHLLGDAPGDGVAVGQFRHWAPPSA